jgi:hypothetical protein
MKCPGSLTSLAKTFLEVNFGGILHLGFDVRDVILQLKLQAVRAKSL